MNPGKTTQSAPTTVIVRHRVLPGKESRFEAWLLGIVKACRTFSGFMGTEVIRPVNAEDENYVCIFRFDHFANLERWMESKERSKWLDQTDDFSVTSPKYDHYYSMEFMFLLEKNLHKTPSKLKMTFVTMLGLFLPVHFIPRWVATGIELPIATTITSLLFIVPIMVYLIMPILTKALSRWLY